jgi:hypothetical protein
MDYVVHPGDGRITPGGSIVSIDAGTLASLYGLSPGDYTVGTEFAPTAIHLTPKQDGKYKNIKTELHDNGLDYFYDYPAFMHTTRDGRYKSKRSIQPQYKDSFRDGRNADKIL